MLMLAAIVLSILGLFGLPLVVALIGLTLVME